MKKIALIYLGRKGGAVPYSFEMTKALLQKNVSVFCVLSEYIQNKSEWEKLSMTNSHLYVIFVPTYKSKLEFIKSIFNEKPYKLAVQQVKGFEPDAIYLPMISLNARKIIQQLPEIPLITTIHDFTQHLGSRNVFTQWIHEYILRHTDKFVVLTKSYAELTANKYHVSLDLVQHIPHANFSYYNVSGAVPILDEIHHSILFFGRITKYKGISILLKAFDLIINELPNMKLIIAGSGELNSEDVAIIDKYHQNIIFKNEWLPDSCIWELFSNVDITIVPYIEASQSGVVAISFSAGRTVVASDIGGLKEQVEPGKGILVSPNDPIELAGTIISLYFDPNKIVELNKCAYKYATESLTWAKSAELLLNLIYKK